MTANEIKGLRARLGLTQAALARRLRVQAVTVARWEQGTRAPDEVNRRRLANIVRKEAQNG